MARVFYRHRLLAALAICLSGWALLPFVSFSRELFDWEHVSGVYKIFGDGVETGDTSAWSQTIPTPPLRIPVPKTEEQLVRRYLVDFQLLRQMTTDNALEILAALSHDGQDVFALEARFESPTWTLRARARRNDGSWSLTDWREVDSSSARLELDWRRALENTRDGHLYVSLDDDLILWLVDLDNHRIRVEELSLMQVDERLVLQPLVD